MRYLLELFIILKSGMFSSKYYYEQYPDVRTSKYPAIVHFIGKGWKEGRNPSRYFDTSFYLQSNSDVKNAGINPLVHYIRHGKREGRLPFDGAVTPSAPMGDGVPMPEWIVTEMRNMSSEIYPEMTPSQIKLATYHNYKHPINKKPGEVYRGFLKKCSGTSYTHCFALPWLKRGGADYVALLHVRFAAGLPEGKVLVILTEPGDSPWLERLPSGVDVIDVSKELKRMTETEMVQVLARLLLQLDIQTLHIINSRLVWEVVKNYGNAVRNKTKIFASVFCDDYDRYGEPVGYARTYLPVCYRLLTNVFCDNSSFPALLRKTYGYPEELFRVLHSPIASVSFAERKAPSKKVLWAGRLDRQKRPDILLKIVEKLPDVQFDVYGEPLLESPKNVISQLKKQKNVDMKGSFNGVEALGFEDYALFLYTSQWDGIPTMVIAAALAGIPVVASAVGGVGEVISGDRGYPVADYENSDKYVEAVRMILSDRKTAEAKAGKALEYVMTVHTEDRFGGELLNTPGYVAPSQKQPSGER